MKTNEAGQPVMLGRFEVSLEQQDLWDLLNTRGYVYLVTSSKPISVRKDGKGKRSSRIVYIGQSGGTKDQKNYAKRGLTSLCEALVWTCDPSPFPKRDNAGIREALATSRGALELHFLPHPHPKRLESALLHAFWTMHDALPGFNADGGTSQLGLDELAERIVSRFER
jgi:hypothetical protein